MNCESMQSAYSTFCVRKEPQASFACCDKMCVNLNHNYNKLKSNLGLVMSATSKSLYLSIHISICTVCECNI